jgi:hypothetical protein
MKEPVDHIERPRLPWRSPTEPALTECGHDVAHVKTLSRAAYFQRLKDYGRQRTGLLTCMTCMTTAGRWPTWDEDPRQAVAREVSWECLWNGERGHRLRDELVAIAGLIERHRAEFDAMLTEIEARRAWVERKGNNR